MENKLGETRWQRSNLEATNVKQAEEIVGLLCNMEELSNTNVEMERTRGRRKGQSTRGWGSLCAQRIQSSH